MIRSFWGISLLAILATSWAQAAPPNLEAALSAANGAQSVIAAQVAAQTLRDQFGLTPSGDALIRPQSAFLAGGAPVIELVDMRLLLAQIAVQTGAKDHLILARAAAGQQVILLRGGQVTLTQFQRLIAASDAGAFVTATAQTVTLTRPLVIWADAGLTLRKGENLILSRPDGSFLANLGWLDIQNATISASTPPNLAEPIFRPFVLTAGRGSLTISDGRFVHLGFGQTPRFGGMAVDNSGLEPPQTPPVITNSHFDDVTALALISTRSGMVAGNMMNATSILIAHGQDTHVTGNFVKSSRQAAIRITKASVKTWIADNIILGAPLGISADQSSRQVTLAGNLLAGQTRSAIRLDKVDCAEVRGNLALQSLGSGIALSGTGRVAIAGNIIWDNLGAGIALRRQDQTAITRVTGNQFSNNHEGLRGASAGDLTLHGNDLARQLPHLFAGDLAPRMILWLEHRRSQGPEKRASDPTPICPLEGNM